MTERMDTEALRALVAAKDMHDDRGVLCVTSEHEDQSWGMSISICEPFDTDKIVKSLAAEVLELRANLAEIAPALAVMHSESKSAFDDLDATRKRLHAMHRRAQKAEASLAKQVPALREELSDAREVLGNIGAMGISHDPQVASSIATRAVFMAQSGWRREYRKAMEMGK